MNKFAKRLLVIIPLLAFLILAIIAAALLNRGDTNTALTIASKDYGPVIPFAISGLSDHDLHGRPILLTFFASWCAPCLVEHPTLMSLSKHITIDGIDFMDKPEDLKAFLENDGNPYRKIGQDTEGTSGVAFGVTGLPTSFIINADGHIIYRHDGPLMAADMPRILQLMGKK